MSFLSEYLERQRNIKEQEDAQRREDAASPEELLQALSTNTQHTADLIGDRSEEARGQTKAVLDSLEVVSTAVRDLQPPKETNKPDIAAASFKIGTITNKELLAVNETLKKLLETNVLIEKHLRPELNSKDDTYQKKKEIAEKATEGNKTQPASGGGLGGAIGAALADLFLNKDKKVPKPGEGAPKPGAPKPGEGAKPGGKSFSEKVGYKAGKAYGTVKNVLGNIGTKVSAKITELSPKIQEYSAKAKVGAGELYAKGAETAKPLTTKVSSYVARAAEAIEPSLTKVKAAVEPTITKVVEATKPAATKVIEATKSAGTTLVEGAKAAPSKMAEFAARAKEVVSPTATKALDTTKSFATSAAETGSKALSSVKQVGTDLLGKFSPSEAKTVGTAANATAAAAEGATPGLLSRGLGTVGKVASKLAVPLTVGMGGYEAYQTEQNTTLTRDQKNVKHGGTAAGTAGALAGGTYGATLGATVGSVVPVVGTAIGGIAGGIIGGTAGYFGGSKIGETAMEGYQSVRDKSGKYADKIAKGYEATKKDVSANYDSAKEKVSSGWSSLKSGFSSAKDSVVGGLKSAKDAVIESPVTSAALAAVPMAGLAAKALSNQAVTTGKSVATGAKDMAVGGLSSARDALPSGVNTALGASVALAVAPFSEDARKALANDLLPAMQNVGKVFKDSSDGLKDSVTKTAETFTEKLAEFSTKLASFWDDLKNTGSSLWAGAKSAVSSVGKAVSSTASGVASGAKEGWKSGDGVMGGIKSAAKGAVSGGREAGTKASSELTKDLSVSKGIAVGRFNPEEQAALAAGQSKGEKFRGGKGLTQEHKDMITKIATEKGIPPEHMLAMAQMESGGNSNAISSTGASGLFQFTGGTAKDMGLKNRFDPEQNTRAAADLYLKNKTALEKTGEKATLDNIYLAHQQGAGGASNILKASRGEATLSDTSKKNMGLNVGANAGGANEKEKAANFAKANQSALAAAQAKALKTTVAEDTYNKTVGKEATKLAESKADVTKVAAAPKQFDPNALLAAAPTAAGPSTSKALTQEKMAKVSPKAITPEQMDRVSPKALTLTEASSPPPKVSKIASAPEYVPVAYGNAKGTKSLLEKPVAGATVVAGSAPSPELVPDVGPSYEEMVARSSKPAPVSMKDTDKDYADAYAEAKELSRSSAASLKAPSSSFTSKKIASAEQVNAEYENLNRSAPAPSFTSTKIASAEQVNAEYGITRSAPAPAINAYQSPLPTLSASVPEETQQVSVSNAEELRPAQNHQSKTAATNVSNSFDTAIPRLDNIPLQITDLGLVLLNIGHV
jgi:hypothetical protein